MKINNLFVLVLVAFVLVFTSGCVTGRNVEVTNGPEGYKFKDKSWSTSPFSTLSSNGRSTQLFRLEIGGGGYAPAAYSYSGGYSYGGYGTYGYVPNSYIERQQYRNTMHMYGIGGGHNRPPAPHQQPPQRQPAPPRQQPPGQGGGGHGGSYGYGR